jgi:hypothetical protein
LHQILYTSFYRGKCWVWWHGCNGVHTSKWNHLDYSYAGDIVGMHKGCIIQLMNQKRCEVSGSFHDCIRKHLNATIWECSHAEHVHFTLLFLSVSLNLSLCL